MTLPPWPAAGDLAYFALRALLLLSLYGFIALVVRVAMQELRELAAARPAPRADARLARMLLLDGGESGLAPGTAWELQPVTSIGRRHGNDIEIDDPFLSARHAEVIEERGEWWVRDLGSTNGTLLNGAPVGALTGLSAGDIVQFGFVRLQVIAGSGAAEPMPRRSGG